MLQQIRPSVCLSVTLRNRVWTTLLYANQFKFVGGSVADSGLLTVVNKQRHNGDVPHVGGIETDVNQ